MEEKKILVVDDEQMILDMYTNAFSPAGYSVQTAKNAEEALKILHTTPYWVVFLDLNMPGMNGVELCRQIRAEWPIAIVHAVTGYGSVFELQGCREAGFEDYFIKPAKIDDLLDTASAAFAKLDRWKTQ